MRNWRPDMTMRRPPTDRVIAASLLAAAALLVAAAWWLAGWTGPDAGGGRGLALAVVLLTSLPWAAVWIGAAAGYGWPLRRLLLPAVRERGATQIALGVATLLVIDAAAGRAGLLSAGRGAGAWAVLGIGLILLLEQGRRALAHRPALHLPRIHPLYAAALPAIAVLLVAACSAPGWLWSTEFGGYDALSYHLQLPREWLALGRVRGLPHNVYSHLPSYVETAYHHLFLLTGGAIEAAYACQMLHACLALLTAFVTARAAQSAGGRLAGPIAAALLLGTPWVIVTGSLAYDEMAMTLALAGAMVILTDGGDSGGSMRRAIALGLLAGAACGAKPTAVAFVLLPVLVVLAAEGRSLRRTPAEVGVCAMTAAAALAPALIANGVETGNPTFPFLTGLFGTGHWTAVQAAIWTGAHQPPGSLSARLGEAWDQLMRYGIGPAPDPREPWRAQWSIVPWITVAAAAGGLAAPRLRAIAWRPVVILAVQVVAWVAATHVKSRFMLPAVVPSAVLVGGVASRLIGETGVRRVVGTAAAALLLAAECCLPAVLFRTEKDGRPAAAIGAARVFSGDVHAAELERLAADDPERETLLASAPPALWINHLLGPDARVLCVGAAAPFYYDDAAITYQTTWDRGPISAALRVAGGDGAALVRELRRRGFTHLFVDPLMLSIWAKAGWNDPRLTAARITTAAEDNAVVVRRFSGGEVLYQLGGSEGMRE